MIINCLTDAQRKACLGNKGLQGETLATGVCNRLGRKLERPVLIKGALAPGFMPGSVASD